MTPQTTELEIIAATPDVEDMESAMPLAVAFEPFEATLAKWKAKAESLTVTSEDQKSEMAMARMARLELRAARVALDKLRKGLKEKAQERVVKIDTAARLLRESFESLEAKLLADEEFAIRKAEERRAALEQARRIEMQPYVAGMAMVPSVLADFTDEAWAKLLADAKEIIDLRAARAKIEEEARIAREKAEAEERERIRVENERLKKEAQERELAARLERERLERERKAAEAKAAEERRALEAKHRAEQAAAEAAAKKEREERERLEREIADRQAAEQARLKAEAAAAAKAAQAPDKTKLLALSETVAGIAIPVMGTPEGAAVAGMISGKIEWLAKWIAQQVEQLA